MNPESVINIRYAHYKFGNLVIILSAIGLDLKIETWQNVAAY